MSACQSFVMKFLSTYKTAERGVPPPQEEMAKMGKLIEDGIKAGFLLATEGCPPNAMIRRVPLDKSERTIRVGENR